MCGSGAGAPANTSSQVTTSNIPEYMRPYAQAMLGGAMKQAFTTDSKGNVTGTRPYQAYGVDPAAYNAVIEAQNNPILGWNDRQKKNNPEAYAEAQRQLTNAQGALQQATQAQYMPYKQTAAYKTDEQGNLLGTQYDAQGNPIPGSGGAAGGSAAVAGFSPMQLQAMNAARQLQVPGQFAQATDYANQAAQGSLGIAALTPGLASASMGYGASGAGYGAKASEIGIRAWQDAQRRADRAAQQAEVYGAGAAQTGLQGLGYGAQGAGYGANAAAMAGMGYGAGANYAAQATSPGAVQAYMNPYIQASLAPQLQLLGQQTGIQGAGQQAAATSSGAFGGSRSALANALSQQAGNLAAQQAIGQGYNQAYQNAIQSMQYGSGLGLQGLQAGTQAQLAGMQGAQTGIAGISPALQGYQTGLQGVGQQINAGELGIHGAQAALQGQGLGIQGAQTGIQGVQGAVGANQLGLQSYGQVGAQGMNLANIGNMQLGAQQGIIGLQNQLGGIQQQQNQNVINAAMQNFQTEQQYPYQQYSFLNSLLRGLPTSQSTTATYQAAPNPWSQVAGLGIAGAGLYGAMSDIRTKDNIKAVGRLKNGLTQYEFNYRPEFGDPSIRYRGVMAQEVEQIKPEAVGVLPNGYKYVNYDMIGTRMETV